MGPRARYIDNGNLEITDKDRLNTAHKIDIVDEEDRKLELEVIHVQVQVRRELLCRASPA